MVTDFLNEANLETMMEGKSAEDLIKIQIRHCVKVTSCTCAMQKQHEDRILSVEKKLTEVLKSQRGSAPLETVIPKLPKWSYPLVVISAISMGVGIPVTAIIYLILVAKGVLPRIW